MVVAKVGKATHHPMIADSHRWVLRDVVAGHSRHRHRAQLRLGVIQVEMRGHVKRPVVLCNNHNQVQGLALLNRNRAPVEAPFRVQFRPQAAIHPNPVNDNEMLAARLSAKCRPVSHSVCLIFFGFF